jgi:predicted phage terminase large subunit-like protein
MILMPPRHGKSEMASVRFPAWHLGHCPDHEIINCGYNMDLPMRFSRWVREIVRDKAYTALFEQTLIDQESQSAEAWNVTMGGGFTAAGVGGGITGKGAHILIIDDPIKNQEEADSITVRDALWDWYWSTAYTRLAPGGGVLVIQTWWNDDDLAGRLQARMKSDDGKADQFDVVKYPALAEQYEYENEATSVIERHEAALDPEVSQGLKFLRAPGDALHPERYTSEMLRNYRDNMPRRMWSALYQQNPVPDEGMFFQKEWFKMEAMVPPHSGRNVYQAWDFAIGEKNHNDFTVGVTLIQDENNNLHVADIVRFKGDTFTIIEEIIDAAVKWGSEDKSPLLIGFEDGQVWKAIKPLLLARMQERSVFPSYEELKTLTDKMHRASKLQGKLQHGQIWFPQDAHYTPVMMREMLRFPAGAHDDIVDAMAHAVNLSVNKSPRDHARKLRPLKSWKDKIPGLLRDGGSGHMSA